ncbi:MAG: tungsten ABC transporter substrate-binding protein [Euryarchaeota archaeon]|nr:tungsten ABC transporter substrate-binding protein [Euryarchaeota archaeon]
MKQGPVFLALLFLTSFYSGCLSFDNDESMTVRLATTTSMRDSGLLDLLIDDFQKTSPYTVEYVAVGTGAALVLGENKDVDALIVHAPEQELEFVENGFGDDSSAIAWNRFVLLAPTGYNSSIFDAFESIYEDESCFISRGDFSGTHHKEQSIWKSLNQTNDVPMVEDADGYHPDGDWYYSIGQGMGAAINMADEKSCSTLSDRGTALNFAQQTSLQRTDFSDEILFNPYSFIFVSDMERQGAEEFLNFLLNDGQQRIEDYTINDEPAFFTVDSID